MTRFTHRYLAALFAAAVALLMTSGCNQNVADGGAGGKGENSRVLVFASLPSQRLATVQQSHQPIVEMLKKETGREVRFQTGTDYVAVIEGLRDGKIDVAALGPLSYVLAKQQGAQITAVAARVDEKGKAPGYQAYGITWTGSSIKALADFRGKKICFVDRISTSGYLYPRVGLLAMGIEPERDTVPIFAGRHDASVLAVANRQCDAGFALDTVVDRQLIEQGQLQPGQVTTVWKSEIIPGPPLVIANHLPPELRQQLTTALQDKANADYLRANGFCQGECAIADGNAYGYQPTDDADYNGVRDICSVVQNDSCTEG
jgi:phosphonate transport system substrate-binding protein